MGRWPVVGCVVWMTAGCRASEREQPSAPLPAAGSVAGREAGPVQAERPQQPELPPGPPSTTGVEPTWPHGPAEDGGYPEWDYPENYRPVSMEGIQYIESEKGDPLMLGCADGQREGFADVEKYPEIAGCVGRFDPGPNALDGARNGECGDDMPGECNFAANVCAEGWHVCGATVFGRGLLSGRVGGTRTVITGRWDLTTRIGPDDCDNAGPGRFNAGFSHADYEEGCDAIKPYEQHTDMCWHEGWGSEPVCCGEHCEYGECRELVWPGRTKISRGPAEGCGMVTDGHNPGVLCCRDPAYDMHQAEADQKQGRGPMSPPQ